MFHAEQVTGVVVRWNSVSFLFFCFLRDGTINLWLLSLFQVANRWPWSSSVLEGGLGVDPKIVSYLLDRILTWRPRLLEMRVIGGASLRCLAQKEEREKGEGCVKTENRTLTCRTLKQATCSGNMEILRLEGRSYIRSGEMLVCAVVVLRKKWREVSCPCGWTWRTVWRADGQLVQLLQEMIFWGGKKEDVTIQREKRGCY